MTIPELIEIVLDRIRRDRYEGQFRDFLRDRRDLMRAIARYGYECARRGWHLRPEHISADLLLLLQQIRTTGASVEYFPVYLEGAVDRRIRLRSEELRDLAARSAQRAEDLVKKLTPVEIVREKSAVEVLDSIYRDLKVRGGRKPKTARTQERTLPLI